MNSHRLPFRSGLTTLALLAEMTHSSSYSLISLVTAVISLVRLFDWVPVENWNSSSWLFLSDGELTVICLDWSEDADWFLSSPFHSGAVCLGLTFRFTFFVPIVLPKGEGNDWFGTPCSNHLTAAWKSGL